jgi:nucleoside-diphosphate-sugar epimerase/glutathionylspermidine synthase
MGPIIFITGATGFIGGATAALLLRRPEAGRLLLLLRGTSEAAAASRLRQSLARFSDDLSESVLRRCDVILGDLTEPDTLADPRLDEVTHVLHLAGSTSLLSVRGVRQTNVEGTLALASRLRQMPRLDRFLHVGTAYICGSKPPALVRESDYPQTNVQHVVEYTRSKAECELLLKRDFSDLPVVVARPSIVVGHTRLGCGPSASIFWYYRVVDLLRRVPVSLDSRKDIVPVDYVAEALVLLLLKHELQFACYHISAGGDASVSWREMATVFAHYYGKRPENPYQVADFATLKRERDRMRELLGPGDERLMLRVLKPFFEISSTGAEIFENRRLLDEGMPLPPRFTEYLPVCITQPPNQSVYQQILPDAWASFVPAQPWCCGDPIPAERYAQFERRAIFDCCKWNNQADDRPSVCSFPLVLDVAAWNQVARLASELALETLAAESELLERVDLHGELGLPRALRRCLGRTPGSVGTSASPRVLRFDFHWTTDGWRISEANTDVAGGFVEASCVTQLLSACYPEHRSTGDPAGILGEAVLSEIGAGARVGLLHLTAHLEDRQTILYLARRFEDRGIRTCPLGPAQLRVRAGGLEAACDWYRGPLDLLYRFIPAEWLPRLPGLSCWREILAGCRTPACNPGRAVLTQSKRFPLVWGALATPLPTWRSLLPETCSPADVRDLAGGEWVLKPALGHEGRNIRIRGVTDPNDWRQIVETVHRHPDAWSAQRRFDVVPVATPEGFAYPCLGVYVINGQVAGCYGRLASQPLLDEHCREVVVLVRSDLSL